MSGGVDSSVAALLLKQEGFEVTGITYQIWERKESAGGCCGMEAVESARAAADILKIKHYVLNFRDVFEEKVVRPFCEAYLAGKTPNPCVECNRSIKFRALIEKASELGADFIATGHYARIENAEGGRVLKKGADAKKDQSYFLYTMTQSRLKKTLMPLGRRHKEEVRETARNNSLPAADRPESQEICFIEDNDYRRFLSGRAPGKLKPGKIEDRRGNVLGSHEGAAFYTIGQRRGLNINAGKPYYVSEIKGNTVIAGDAEDVYSSSCIVGEVNIISGKPFPGKRAEVKIRHPGEPRPAEITMLSETTARVEFDEPKWAVTPGQSAVFYEGETVTGGGIIRKQEEKNAK